MSEMISRNYVEYPDTYLPSQFDNSTKLKNFLESYLTENEALNQAFVDLSKTTDINTATGYQLDIIGKLVGEERIGRDDLRYRQAIFTRILLNNSNGHHEDILAYLRLATQSTLSRGYELFPAKTIYTTTTSLEGMEDYGFKDLVCAGDTLAQAGEAYASAQGFDDTFEDFFSLVDQTVDRALAIGVNNLGIIHDVDGETRGFCELDEISNLEKNVCAGDVYMQAGEPDAIAISIPLLPDTTIDSLVWSVFPELEIVTGLACAGDEFMYAGETLAVSTRIVGEDDLPESVGVYPEWYAK